MPIIIDLPNEWFAFLVFFFIITFFIGIAEIARKVFKLSPELSRKFVHVMVGVLVSMAPFFLRLSLPVLILGLLFTLINYITLKKDSLKGMHSTERISYGTVYFPIAFTLLVVMFWDRNIIIFIISMLILAFSDMAATLVGEKIDSTKKFILWHDQKSLAGSLTFFIVTVIIILIAYPAYSALANSNPLPLHHLLGLALFSGLITTTAEAVSKQGSDNLSLTLSAGLSMDLYLTNMIQGTLPLLSIWFGFSILLGLGAYKLRSLSRSGAFGAIILGIFLFGIGSWSTVLPLIGFFGLSSILSKLADRHNAPTIIASKGSQRDIVQVYANGGIPLLFAIAWYLSNYSLDWLYWAFLATLASATADTWETEIGSFSRRTPINILTWKKVTRGYSGGITWIGTLGGLFGATTIVSIALLVQLPVYNIHLLLMMIMAAFLGSIVDSLLGAGIQAKFVCTQCDQYTEKLTHCERKSQYASGIPWVSNDWVNVAGTISSGIIFLIAYYFYH